MLEFRPFISLLFASVPFISPLIYKKVGNPKSREELIVRAILPEIIMFLNATVFPPRLNNC